MKALDDKALLLLYRLVSVVVRFVSVSILFYYDSSFAREVLFSISAVYFFQVISGLEIYLNPKISYQDHIAKIFTIGLILSPLLALFFWFNNMSVFWVVYFLFDLILVERSRKQNMLNMLKESNMIAIRRSLIFLLSSLIAILYQSYFMLSLVALTLLQLSFLIKYDRPNFTMVSLPLILKKISVVAVAIAIINRSLDLLIRNVNKELNAPIFEFWDFYLSVFGLLNTVNFYLFIAKDANKILINRAFVSKKAYVFQPLLVLLSIVVSLVYFSQISGKGLDLYLSKTIVNIFIISSVLVLFQLFSWRIISIANSSMLLNNYKILLFFIMLMGAYASMISPNTYLLYLVVLLIFITVVLGMKYNISRNE